MLVPTTTTPYEKTSMDVDNYDDKEMAQLRQMQDKAQATRLAARIAEEEAARVDAQLEECIKRAADKQARREEEARLAAVERAHEAQEAARVLKREKAAEKAAGEKAARRRQAAIRQELSPAHSSNRKPQAGVATTFVKGPRKHKFDSKGVEADDESGHWSDGGLSDDIIMRDAKTTREKKGKKPLRRRQEADEESSGRNKKPKMNTSTGSEPEGDVSPPCDLCRHGNRECTGRARNTACDSCQSSKKACKVDGVSIRVPRSTKRVANSVIVIEEGSNATVAEGHKVAALARDNLELAKKVQGLEGLIVGLYNAATKGEELLPVLSQYMAARQQDNRGKAQQTDDNESLD